MRADKERGSTRFRSVFRDGFPRAFSHIQNTFKETFGLGHAATFAAIILIILVTIFAAFWFYNSTPPKTIIITSGPEGSLFDRTAKKYARILARNKITLKIIPSQGSLENFKRLNDPSFHVDIGFVQNGVVRDQDIDTLVSLGSIFYEPLLIFYRSASPMELLSQMSGKRLAVGKAGSGTHALALTLLSANGIKPGGKTKLLEMDAEDAAKGLIAGDVDAAFMMGDAASSRLMITLLKTPEVKLFSFAQADGYARRITYLKKLNLPRGSADFGKDIPPQDVNLIGPTVELVARTHLHPVLSDLLLGAATEIHGKAGVFQRQGEFPSPVEHEFRISDDASRFYKSGKSFLYRYLPFTMASLANRILAVFVPVFVILIPGLRMITAVYRWRLRMRIYRWYGMLLALERDIRGHKTAEEREALLKRTHNIEQAVNKMKMPASFGEPFYILRGHIGFVRKQLTDMAQLHEG
ncbi:MAG TPA: TAXI family TRAP transporter solute-binding subunit [Syntrophorhabdaceae bacterium]|nr:TAXI family TRAP transporter solute-binding subunit [Syntrophorhabdaceae bacterium]HQM81347.1 TAXI family TRAP transporter solute-binding subunit [Syntrophorhabdaceae bacterium]